MVEFLECTLRPELSHNHNLRRPCSGQWCKCRKMHRMMNSGVRGGAACSHRGSPDSDEICQNQWKSLFSTVHPCGRPQHLIHPSPAAFSSGSYRQWGKELGDIWSSFRGISMTHWFQMITTIQINSNIEAKGQCQDYWKFIGFSEVIQTLGEHAEITCNFPMEKEVCSILRQ